MLNRTAALFTVLLLLAFAAGCATSYQSKSFSGGYSDTQLGERIYEVSFRGNGYTSSERVERFWMRRAAELTQDTGYTHFAILSESGSTRTQEMQIGNDRYRVEPYGGGATVTGREGSTMQVNKHRIRGRIVMFDADELSDTERATLMSAEVILANFE